MSRGPQESLADALKYNDQLKPHLHRMADDLHPLRVRALFENIPDEDLDLLDIQGVWDRMGWVESSKGGRAGLSGDV